MGLSFKRKLLSFLKASVKHTIFLLLVLAGGFFAFKAFNKFPASYPGNWWRQVAQGQYYCPYKPSPVMVTDGMLSGAMSAYMAQVLSDQRISEISLSSPGGNVLTIDELPQLVKSIRVVAPICNSACAWMTAIHENVCVDTSLPALGFHTAIESGWCNADGSRVVNEQVTRELLNRVPTTLQRRLASLLPEDGVAKDNTVFVHSEEYLAMFPEKVCD